MKICRECKKEFEPEKPYFHTCIECYESRPLSAREEWQLRGMVIGAACGRPPLINPSDRDFR